MSHVVLLNAEHEESTGSAGRQPVYLARIFGDFPNEVGNLGV